MKKLVLFICILAVYSSSYGQSAITSFFSQKKTQRKYLAEQIAALKAYKGYLEKGYNIAKSGLNTISDFKNGEFNLHRIFFNSLKEVNPAVRKYAGIADIVAVQTDILTLYKSTSRYLKSGNSFLPNEINYIDQVYTRVLNDCSKNIDELITLITDSSLQMSDDERLAKIDQLKANMSDNYDFTGAFYKDIRGLGQSRLKESREVDTLKTWY
ncbi:hypothetical protein [Chitinophaga sancti]|uniref:TerB family tellurite resistance protein n=1 Tax=Chitinophaga sancti TaxID=1004 RepID=A0A1K1SZQ8_9BACT|nr:hypothetical protein [Chitinophaga sancti]WQD65370.1 hypothetical protein U0033_13295 [Chitinophaga sancti]WQG89006.1 hypothetical protein SR876_29175 [Chitinophaga sancti]SFW89849.1 hypothetical protein SAMN05661012_06508 [Chitinophaga sancti]